MPLPTSARADDVTASAARRRGLGHEALALTRYLIVGGANTALSYVVFRVAFGALRDQPSAPALAQALSYAVGIGVGFMAHSAVTFRVESRSRGQLARYTVLQLSCLLISSVLVQAGVERAHLSPTVAWVLVTGAITVFNFLMQRTWVWAAPAPVTTARAE
jgi:putative flippase GtrA